MLLVRLGIADPEQLKAIAPEEDELLFHACDTTQGVNCAIRKVANALMQGKLDTKRANTLLYALQSCLATIRVEQEAGPPIPRPPLRLAAAEVMEDTACTVTSPTKSSASAEHQAASTRPTRATRSTPAHAPAAKRGDRRTKAKSAPRSKHGRNGTTRHTASTDDED
jgi:hypothetical protein